MSSLPSQHPHNHQALQQRLLSYWASYYFILVAALFAAQLETNTWCTLCSFIPGDFPLQALGEHQNIMFKHAVDCLQWRFCLSVMMKHLPRAMCLRR